MKKSNLIYTHPTPKTNIPALLRRILLVCLFVWFISASQTTLAQQAQPDESHVHYIAQEGEDPLGGLMLDVFFSILDTNQQPLENASFDKENATIIVDGVSYPATISTPLNPFYIAFVLDVSNSMNDYKPELFEAVKEGIEKKPAMAEISLRLFHGVDREVQPFTSTGHLLTDKLDEILERAPQPYTCQFDALNNALISLAEQPLEGRRAVVFLTDGQEQTSSTCDYTQDDLHTLIEFANEQQTAVYPITFGNNDISHLNDLATQTGGLVFDQSNSLPDKFQQIMTSLSSQLVASATVGVAQPGEHSLVLNVNLTSNGDIAQALTTESKTFVTVEDHSPLLKPPYFLEGITPDFVNGRRIATIIFPESFNGCINTHILDLESNLTIPESKREFCSTNGREQEFVFKTTHLKNKHTYCLQLLGHEILPPSDCSEADSSTAMSYKYLDEIFEFKIDVQPLPKEQQIHINIIPLNNTLNNSEALEYTVTIEHDGGRFTTPVQQLGSYEETIVLTPYPTAEEATGAFEFTVNATTHNGRFGTTTQEVTLSPPPDVSFLRRIWESLRTAPVLLALLMVIVILLPLLLALRHYVARLTPATGFLTGKGIISNIAAPPPSATQLPPWTPNPAPPVVLQPNIEQNTIYRPNEVPPATGNPPLTPQAQLTILTAPDKAQHQQMIPITKTPFRIGREGCELNVGDGRTSREHAVITAIDDTFYITDLASVNGTFLDDNDAYLTPHMRWPLNPNSLIRIGTSVEIAFKQH